jgi:hypothetical protein
MLGVENSPHLVIGMRSDEKPPVASSRFAVATKRVRNNPNSQFSIEDLTSALAAIESQSARNHFWYAIPCDSSVIDPGLSCDIDGESRSAIDDYLAVTNVVAPSVETSCAKCGTPFRSTQAKFCGNCGQQLRHSESDSEKAARGMLGACLSALLAWRWQDCISLGQETLRISKDEAKRDEALNLMAAAHCMLGATDKAMGALKHAVQGQWNLGLQTNLAIVATTEDPSLAVEQMRFMIDGADSPEERLEASLKAVALWRGTQSDLTGSNDPDDHHELPDSLLTSIIRLLESNDLNESDFFQLGYFLAENEGERILVSTEFNRSPHKDSPSASLIRYRAEGFFDFIQNVVRVAHEDGTQRPWLVERVEDTVAQVNALLGDEEGAEAGANIAFSLLEQGLDTSSIPRIMLRALGTIRTAVVVAAEDGVPVEKFIDWLTEAKESFERTKAADGEEDRHEFVSEVLETAGTMLAAVYHDNFVELVQAAAPVTDQISYQMGGMLRRLSANKLAIKGGARQITRHTEDAVRLIPKLVRLTSDAELRDSLQNLGGVFKNINNQLAKYK